MKKQRKKLAVILICAALAVSDASPVLAADGTAAASESTSATDTSVSNTGTSADSASANNTSSNSTSAKKNGLRKENGKYYFYKNNVRVRNKWKTVKKKKYYFGADGAAKTGWYTIKSGKKYKTYYFTSRGVLVPKKTKTISAALVKKMDSVIRSRKFTSETTDAQKVNRLFKYCLKTFKYKRAARASLPKNWTASYAEEMLKKKKGSCYHDAAAFAFLVRRATGLPVRVVTGTSNVFNKKLYQKHAWVLVKLNGKWLAYDVNGARYSSTGYAVKGASASAAKKHYKASDTVQVLI